MFLHNYKRIFKYYNSLHTILLVEFRSNFIVSGMILKLTQKSFNSNDTIIYNPLITKKKKKNEKK